jgi:hypothetical protein
MKKILLILAISLLALPVTVGSVTWQMDSAPFSFPTIGAKKQLKDVAHNANFTCHFDAIKNVAVFKYILPAKIQTATLIIYSVSGVQVGTADVKTGSKTAEWGEPGKKIPAGIYFAVLRYGMSEQRIQFSIN